MTEIIDMLRQEHDATAKLLDVIERQVVVFNEKGALNYGIMHTVLDFFMRYPDPYHHPKEDLIFRKLCARDPAACLMFGGLQTEHKELEALTRAFAVAARDIHTTVSLSVRDVELQESFNRAAQNLLAVYRRHIEVEEKKFFPAALKTLSPKDWADIDTYVTEEEDRLLIDKKFERRFGILINYIDRLERIDHEAA